MEIINIIENDNYLTEYLKLCSLEWGNKTTPEELEDYITQKKKKVLDGDKVISILGLIDNQTMIGFISLFKYDGEYRTDLTPWYATMYVKEKYRGKGYSKILNDAILNKAYKLGYSKVYLKTELENYYENFGAVFIEKINEKEKLYYFLSR